MTDRTKERRTCPACIGTNGNHESGCYLAPPTSNPDNELSPRIREFGSHDRFGQPITTQYLRIDEYERLKLERDFHQRTSVKLGDINVARAKQIREVLKSWSLTGDDGLPVEIHRSEQLIQTAQVNENPVANLVGPAGFSGNSPDETRPPRANDQPGSWWTPTAEVERLMRWCKDANTITLEISTNVLEGLLYDSLLWRKDRASQPIKPDETTARDILQCLVDTCELATSAPWPALDEARAFLSGSPEAPRETSDEHEDDNRRLREIHKISTQSRVLPEDVERIAILSQWATDSAEKPFVVTDRMQGVDCSRCEDGTPHLHAPPSSPLEPEPPRLKTDEVRDLACCDTFVRESASEFCATCGYSNLDHLRKRSAVKAGDKHD